MEYFHRQIQLWGEDRQNSLKDKKILIIGSGGLGSSFAYALGSSGVGEICVVDFDTVSLHNIHRQILFSLEDEGKFKADIFKKRTEARFDGVCVRPFKMKADEFFKTCTEKFDLILDATDNLATRMQIDEFAKKTGASWIFTSVDSWQVQVCFIEKSDFKFFPTTTVAPAGLAAPIVMFAASFAANLALRYLANLEVKKDTLYYLNFFSGEFETKKIALV